MSTYGHSIIKLGVVVYEEKRQSAVHGYLFQDGYTKLNQLSFLTSEKVDMGHNETWSDIERWGGTGILCHASDSPVISPHEVYKRDEASNAVYHCSVQEDHVLRLSHEQWLHLCKTGRDLAYAMYLMDPEWWIDTKALHKNLGSVNLHPRIPWVQESGKTHWCPDMYERFAKEYSTDWLPIRAVDVTRAVTEFYEACDDTDRVASENNVHERYVKPMNMLMASCVPSVHAVFDSDAGIALIYNYGPEIASLSSCWDLFDDREGCEPMIKSVAVGDVVRRTTLFDVVDRTVECTPFIDYQ